MVDRELTKKDLVDILAEADPLPYINDIGTCYSNYAIAAGKLGRIKEAKALLKKAESYGYTNGSAVRKLLGIKKGLFSR